MPLVDIHYSLKRTVSPASEPVTLAEAKSNLRVDIAADDDEITRLIKEAREELEQATASAYVTQTWVLSRDRFPVGGEAMAIPLCPVASVSSVVYLDAAGASQTLSGTVYTVDISSTPARLGLAAGKQWPATIQQANAVLITFVAGYGDAAAVPNLVKRAIKLRVAHWYTYRGIATDAKHKAGEDAWSALKQSLRWGDYP